MSKQQKNNTAVEPLEIKKATLTSEQKALATTETKATEELVTTISTEKKQLTVTESKPNKSKPTKETVTAIRLDQIQPFENHPFRVEADAAMAELKASVALNGVLEPVLLRPKGDGFEMLSGHRRMAVCKELGIETIPAIVRNLDDDQATLAMVDANRQREHILPSEKAFSYKMRDDALKHLRAGQVVPPVGRTTEQIGKENDESDRNVRRMIRLTKLIPPLLDMVDRGKLGTTTAVELSYLSKKEQEAVQTAIESEQSIPSQTQAKMLRRLHDEDEFTEDTPLQVLSGNKGKAAEKLTIPMTEIARFFRSDTTPAQMIEAIVKALELLELKKKRDRQMAR